MLMKSAELGNPYAMIEYAQVEDEKESWERYLTAYQVGLYKGLVNYIEDKYDSFESEDNRELIAKYGLENVINELLSSIQGLQKYEEVDGNISKLIAKMYKMLNSLTYDKYRDEYLYYMKKNDELYMVVQDEQNTAIAAIESYLDLKVKYKELEAAYNELKKLKELDFNNLISNSVGNYLN